ncbi:hypothetical protein WJX84_002860 [Apatococcus fuscideae]|uniref:HMG box domain-containing protein n=1 Tax=Apatococcus fuscideae TaxID=2026836 RepID=A0AAW1SKQ2_9CHLO
MVEYEKEHPRPARRHKKERDPSQLKRPQSAYFFFLADYREAYKKEHPGEPVAVKVIGKAAGDQWRDMGAEAREPYEQKSTENKKSYALMKTLTPQERCDYTLAVEQGHVPPMTFEEIAMPDAEGQGEGQEGPSQRNRSGPSSAAPHHPLPAPGRQNFDYPPQNQGIDLAQYPEAQPAGYHPQYDQHGAMLDPQDRRLSDNLSPFQDLSGHNPGAEAPMDSQMMHQAYMPERMSELE